MQILSETAFDDGSSWCAAVTVKGVVYRASFVASKLTVGLGPYKYPPRRPRWAEKAVRKWAETRVAALPASWMAAHAAMYAQAPVEAL
jgi:hypothetical protein